MAAGADFIKTSTGKVTPAATLPVTLVMLEASATERQTGRAVGMKPAGRIAPRRRRSVPRRPVRDPGTPVDDPDRFRFGASNLLNDVLMQIDKERSGRYSDPDDYTLDRPRSVDRGAVLVRRRDDAVATDRAKPSIARRGAPSRTSTVGQVSPTPPNPDDVEIDRPVRRNDDRPPPNPPDRQPRAGGSVARGGRVAAADQLVRCRRGTTRRYSRGSPRRRSRRGGSHRCRALRR
jgi:hypothetical protein